MKRIPVFVSILVIAVVLVNFSGCRFPFCPKDEPPAVIIDKPPVRTSGVEAFGDIIVFGWRSAHNWNPSHIRYMHSMVVDTDGNYNPAFDIIGDLNANPSRYEEMWSDWISYRAPDNAGRTMVLGDDEDLVIGKQYIFAVQARNSCGGVTEVFERGKNVRLFTVIMVKGPLLVVWEPFLGGFKFIGENMPPQKREVPPGIPLNFRWEGDASSYGGLIQSYRYGWDIQDINDPSDWDVSPHPSHKSAPEKTFFSGTHTLFIEVVDNGAYVTLGQITIEVIPFTMERNLLWVDDFYSVDPQSPLYEHPSESNHDAFWLDICSRAEGFDSQLDVYDCYYDHNLEPPTLNEMGKYKNIIWTYSSSGGAWSEVVVFTPESHVGIPMPHVNPLPLFLASGGHLWTQGRSERLSGLSAVFPDPPLFPASFRDDMAPFDTSGVFCMGYKDYCVTMVDKVLGTFRTGDGMPPRSLDWDAMRQGYRDDADWVTAEYPDLPEQLELWEEVTASGRFFDVTQRGFYYVEVYDPGYYMDYTFTSSQECFHPMYRMRARNTLSALDHCTVAIWLTKYDDVVPNAETGPAVAARSVHFGLPLWFFNRDQVDEIADVVFGEWQILAAP